MSYEYRQRIGDRWCDALGGGTWNVVNPATEETVRTGSPWVSLMTPIFMADCRPTAPL